MSMRYSIVVVEDDSELRRLLTSVIEHIIPADVRAFGDNLEALAAVAERKPHLVVSDFYRARGLGSDLVAALRGSEETSDIPIVIISGALHKAVQDVSWLRFGCDAALLKPFQVDDLAEVLDRVLRRRPDPDGALLDVGRETATLDYKEDVDTGDKKAVASLAKDVLAMANIGGGSIVVGVTDLGGGNFEQTGLADSRLPAFEVTRLNDSLRQYVGERLAVTSHNVRRNGRTFVVVKVPSSEGAISMARKDHEGAGLFTGRIYHRTDAGRSEEAKEPETVQRLLDRLKVGS